MINKGKKMKKRILKTTLLLSLVMITNACATPTTWLDGGSKVNANIQESNSSKTSELDTKINKSLDKSNDEPFEVTLATGAKTIIIGGVYVKTKKVQTVLDWAQKNGYTAIEHTFIDGAINITTTPSQAIEVANQIAQLEGVSTAAPKQSKKLIKK